MGIARLGYIGIESARLDAWASFAVEVLGLAVGEQGEDGELLLRMDDRPARLIVHPGAQERVAYIGWEVSDEGSMDDLVRALAATSAGPRRAKSDELARRQVGALVQATDPAGHAIELFATPAAATTPFRSSRPI